MSQLVVQAPPVSEDVVLAEVFPVVRGDDDPGVLEQSRGAEAAKEAAELGVQADAGNRRRGLRATNGPIELLAGPRPACSGLAASRAWTASQPVSGTALATGGKGAVRNRAGKSARGR